MIVFFFKSMQWQNSPKLVTVLVRKRKMELHQFDLINFVIDLSSNIFGCMYVKCPVMYF